MNICELKVMNPEWKGEATYYLVPKNKVVEMYYSNPEGHLDKVPDGVSKHFWDLNAGGRIDLRTLTEEETCKILDQSIIFP